MTDHICPADHSHDTTSTCYQTHGCRCTPCRTGRTEYRYWASHMHAAGRDEVFEYALVDATGTRRRLQALMALGWSQRHIAAAAGTDQNRISSALHAERVARITTKRIAAVYEQLSFRIPPTDTVNQRASVSRVLANARRNNWAPPLAWDDIDTDPAPATTEPTADIDDVAIALAITGRPVRLTPAERRVCVRILHGRSYSDGVIADTLHCTSKTIERIRDELHLEAHEQADLITRKAA